MEDSLNIKKEEEGNRRRTEKLRGNKKNAKQEKRGPQKAWIPSCKAKRYKTNTQGRGKFQRR